VLIPVLSGSTHYIAGGVSFERMSQQMHLIRVGGWPFRLPPEALVIRRPYGRCMDSTASIERPTLAVQTSGLGKRFGTQAALDGVDLEVPRGSAFGFLGPNGAGKTTLIRLLLGLAEPTAGSMRLLGRELPAKRAAALARVGANRARPWKAPKSG
jgi:ABC-type molybdenum transport system ATPase subunit/photorepair protein PhrA